LLEGSDGEVAVVGAKARHLLTLLALSTPGQVTLDQVVDFLWDDPPPSAVKTVQAHLSRLRSTLSAAGAPGAVSGGGVGYRLDLGDRLDVTRLDELVRRGHDASAIGDAELAAQLFNEARALWRGDVELADSVRGDALRRRLADERLELTIAALAAMIDAGVHDQALPELGELVEAEPYNERVWELRIVALYRSGRPTDALRAYQDATRRLADEIGVAPGPALRELEARVLAHDALAVPDVGRRRSPQPRLFGDIGYARSAGTHIAHRSFGSGEPAMLMISPGMISIDALVDDPHPAEAIARLAANRRVVAFDPRGIGLSDRTQPPDTITLDDWVDDAVAVLDASALDRVDVFASGHGGLIGLALAGRHGQRVRSITLMNAFARATRAPDYPHGIDPAMHEALASSMRAASGPKADALTLISPSVAADPVYRQWWDTAGRRAASPATAATFVERMIRADVRELVPLVAAPALVIVRNRCPIYDPAHSTYLARHLPNATFEEHDDINEPWWVGTTDLVIDAIDRFIASVGEV